MDGRVAVFAPSPQLTVTVEEMDGGPDIHLHAGGQGFWQTRMITSLGVPVVFCAACGGETGQVLRNLMQGPDIELRIRDVAARNSAYLHDRRDGDRSSMVEMPPDPLTRHELDDLYEMTLLAALETGIAVLSGPSDEQVVPHELYRRLTADLTSNGCLVVVDLAGERLANAIEGGPTVIKVSHEELVDDGRAASDSVSDLIHAAEEMAECGAKAIVISRAADPALVFMDGEVSVIETPSLETVDTRGGGDSMSAGIAAALAQGAELSDALKLGAAAGVLNVTRHGLGTGSGETVRALSERVTVRPLEKERETAN